MRGAGARARTREWREPEIPPRDLQSTTRATPRIEAVAAVALGPARLETRLPRLNMRPGAARLAHPDAFDLHGAPPPSALISSPISHAITRNRRGSWRASASRRDRSRPLLYDEVSWRGPLPGRRPKKPSARKGATGAPNRSKPGSLPSRSSAARRQGFIAEFPPDWREFIGLLMSHRVRFLVVGAHALLRCLARPTTRSHGAVAGPVPRPPRAGPQQASFLAHGAATHHNVDREERVRRRAVLAG